MKHRKFVIVPLSILVSILGIRFWTRDHSLLETATRIEVAHQYLASADYFWASSKSVVTLSDSMGATRIDLTTGTSTPLVAFNKLFAGSHVVIKAIDTPQFLTSASPKYTFYS